MMVAASFVGATVASAGKPPRATVTNSITLNQADPHLGDSVTFTNVYDTSIKSPRVQVVCTQDGAVTYAAADAADQSFVLGGGSSAWKSTGGEADCVATLYYWDWKPVQTFVPLASTSFHAGGAR
jgi:hypothetical protein